MNKVNRKGKNLILLILFALYIVIYRLVIYGNFLKYNESINAAFSILILALSIFFLGYRKVNNNQYKGSFIRVVIVSLFLYFIGTYGAGLIIGFLSNSYSLKFESIFNNIFCILVSIISLEVFRYTFISANKDNKVSIAILTILLMLFDINFVIKEGAFSSLETSFHFITVSVLPIIMKNIMCSYLTYYTDYKASLIYRIVMDLYIYVAPIQPDLNDFVLSIVNLVLPFLVIMYCNSGIYEKDNVQEHTFGQKFIKLVDVPFIIILILFSLMIFNIGPYRLIGIETASMTPKIKVGDAVVVEKNVNTSELKEGDIIAYRADSGIIIVHRIINVNSDDTFTTKGDFNNTADSKYVSPSQVVGKVKMKIPFIAYPKVIFK